MISIDPIIPQERLLEVTGYEHSGDLEKWLRRNGIRYHRGKGNRIFTTVLALTAKLEEVEEIEFE